MPTPRARRFDPFAPTAPALVAWPAWLAFAALVMAVGLVELALTLLPRVVTRARWIVGGLLIGVGVRVLPDAPADPDRPARIVAGAAALVGWHEGGERGGAT